MTLFDMFECRLVDLRVDPASATNPHDGDDIDDADDDSDDEHETHSFMRRFSDSDEDTLAKVTRTIASTEVAISDGIRLLLSTLHELNIKPLLFARDSNNVTNGTA